MRIQNYFLTFLISLLIFSCKKSTTTQSNVVTPYIAKDVDGNIYDTVVIGTQTWMVQNLKVMHFRNGEAIANDTGVAVWTALTTPAWCYYKNDSTNNIPYGKLYNWFAVNDPRGLAPEGWHVPSDSEFVTLENYLGGVAVCGGKMKERDTTHWHSPNVAATDSVGFKAVGAGDMFETCCYGFGWKGEFCMWWTTTEINVMTARFHRLTRQDGSIFKSNGGKTYGYSVRCIRNK
ncbi:MAG: hypothetical protein JWN78_2878 [Bacteroidota bacterium]|nr:hypothetical protein [Bacteroidota bacterium]